MLLSAPLVSVDFLKPAGANIATNLSIPPEKTLVNPLNIEVNFDPPPSDGDPQGTSGGGSRDGNLCVLDPQSGERSITPLVPASQYGLTITDHPTLLIHVPKTSAKNLFLSLEDANENSLYHTTVSIENKAGIVSVSLPTHSPALETGKYYKWSIVLICGEALDPNDPVTEVWVYRVKPDFILTSSLKQATPLEQAALFGRAGVWYDALTKLAELRRLHPEDPLLVANWEKLLQSVGLGAFATEPLVQ